MKSQKPPRGTLLNKSHPLARGLVGCWLMNEGTGERIFDYSGNNNHGLMTNMDATTDWVGGEHGMALDFDGSNDFVSIPAINVLLSVSTLTVITRLQTGILYNNSNGALIGQYEGDNPVNNRAWALAIVNNKARFQISKDGTSSTVVYAIGTTNIYNDSSIIQICGRWDSAYIDIFVNGMIDGSPGVTDTIYNTVEPIRIGAHDVTNRYVGKIYDVVIYNRALSAAEIAWLYREPYAMFRNNPRSFKEVKKIYSRGGASR